MAQSSPTKNNIALVGAGPAGIYCAIHILNKFKNNNFSDFQLDIFDKSQILRTILPTGAGRCNLTNAICDKENFLSNYPRGEKFFNSLFSRHSNFDSIDFFNSIGIKTYTQKDLRVFPKSNSAKEVRDKLLNKLNSYDNFKIINKKIESLSQLKKYSKIIISTGSRNVENLIKSTSQPYLNFLPSLGSLKIENNIYPKGVSVKSPEGDFIFTDKGISGPLVYKIASINSRNNYPYEVEIKLFDSNELLDLIKNNPKKSIGNLVGNFIPKSLARVIVQNYLKNACEISKKEAGEYSFLKLKVLSPVLGGEIVNSGGIDLKYLDKNCKSKLNKNLWFCGEILNIDGFCGGFNLQNCWSSAYIVALDVVKSIMEENKKDNQCTT